MEVIESQSEMLRLMDPQRVLKINKGSRGLTLTLNESL